VRVIPGSDSRARLRVELFAEIKRESRAARLECFLNACPDNLLGIFKIFQVVAECGIALGRLRVTAQPDLADFLTQTLELAELEACLKRYALQTGIGAIVKKFQVSASVATSRQRVEPTSACVIGKRIICVALQKKLDLLRFQAPDIAPKRIVFEIGLSGIAIQLFEQAIELADLVSLQRMGGIVKQLALLFDARLCGRADHDSYQQSNRTENFSDFSGAQTGCCRDQN